MPRINTPADYHRLARLFRRLSDCTLVFPDDSRIAREFQKAQAVFPGCRPNWTWIRNLIAAYDLAGQKYYLGNPNNPSLLDDTLRGKRVFLPSYY